MRELIFAILIVYFYYFSSLIKLLLPPLFRNTREPKMDFAVVNYYFRHSWLNFFDENTIIVDKVRLLRWFERRSEDPLLTALVQNNATISTMYIVTLVAQTFHTTLPRVQTNSKGPCIAWHRRCAVRSSLNELSLRSSLKSSHRFSSARVDERHILKMLSKKLVCN